MKPYITGTAQIALICAFLGTTPAQAKAPAGPDALAAQKEAQMTDAERIQLLHGSAADNPKAMPAGAIPSAGFTPGIPRLGIPALQETDASLGVAWIDGLRKDGATAMPSGLALASTWDPAIAYHTGAAIAKEARAKGFNVLLAGGVNLARDPRNGRNFEYLGEDPLLGGVMAGSSIKGIEESHMISTVKHLAANGQETGRMVLSSVLSDKAARESDLLAFRIAIDIGKPGAVMCAYNRYNGPYSCQSDYLLNDVLKHDWRYPGFAMSDWGATHSADDLLHGLDYEAGQEFDAKPFFQNDLPALNTTNSAVHTRIRDADRRILRSMYAAGLFDHPPQITAIDPAEGAKVARQSESAGIVLLKNNGILPLLKTAKRVAVIGGFAADGVIAGGGSSEVMPLAGPAADMPGTRVDRRMRLHPSSPLAALKATLSPGTRIDFDQGYYPDVAADWARQADVAIVFATQWSVEGQDLPNLDLPRGQDALIEAVAAANPHTIVVLETGGPVLMPWLDKVSAVVEAWYPGIEGGPAIADVLTGDVNPSGHLPMTFPASLSQLPRPKLPDSSDPARAEGSRSYHIASFDVDYNIEGSDVGYRWFARKDLKPLFPFGFGLSYTHFQYSGLTLHGGRAPTATFTVSNSGSRAGRDVPQVYVTKRAGQEGLRLVGWQNVMLAPGEEKRVTVTLDPKLLADWSEKKHAWVVLAGRYDVRVAHSAEDNGETQTVTIAGQIIR